MKPKAEHKQRKDKAAASAILAFFASFSTFFFIPFDLFDSNLKEITIPAPFVAVTLAAVTAAVFAAVFLLCFFTEKTANYICTSLIFAVTLAFYIQSNFLSLDMEELNAEYSPKMMKVILNAVFWVILTAAVFVLHKKYEKKYIAVSAHISAAVVLIEIITVSVSSVAAADRGDIVGVSEKYLSDVTQIISTTDNINTYSTEKNYIIIIVDSYDSFNFDKVRAAHPETLSEFDGFIYYSNTLGCYQATDYALPHILTGNGWENENPFENERLFERLKEDYDVNIYSFIFDPVIFEKYADNYFLANYMRIDVGIDKYAELGKIFYKASMFKAMPEVFKKRFWVSSESFNLIFTQTERSLSQGFESYSYDDLDFYNSLTDEIVLTEKQQFKFIYLLGTHGPRNITADLQRAEDWSVSPEDSSEAVNKILNRYLGILKQNGGTVYDNSDIIILADHGIYPMDVAKYPLLMYKPAGADSEGITVSNAPISYEEIYPTLMMLAGGEPEGRTIFDIGEDEVRERYHPYTDEYFTGNIKEIGELS